VRILDRQRYWAFGKAYITCYVSFVGLWIVLDAFSNVDEFSKRASGLELFKAMGQYYLVRQAEYFDRLGGVISMMAAIFTVTWMQRANEQLAMLAAGVSTHRIIRPVVVCSILVSFLSIANQELIIPRYAEELQKSHADDGTSTIAVLSTPYDARGLMLSGKEADRAARTMLKRFNVTVPVQVFGSIREIEGRQATYIPPEASRVPLRGGWLVRGAKIQPPIPDEELAKPDSIVVKVTDQAGFPPPVGNPAELEGDAYFVRTTLSFEAMTRKTNWHQYGSMTDLVAGLVDPSTDRTEQNNIELAIHSRALRPFLALTLMFMSLPLVLGGYGRNMFINLGFALGNSAIFYGVGIFCLYLGGESVLSPALAAWLPLFVFGALATHRWGQIRT
jgi:lipopolysaccharide export system permease protein